VQEYYSIGSALQKIYAVITGAGSGLGRAMALQLYQAGAHLALCDLHLSGLEEKHQLTGGSSDRVSLHIVDVSDREQMFSLRKFYSTRSISIF
jgi:NADP-dependent 3-hydroxy acid dehydrogenase YdfG